MLTHRWQGIHLLSFLRQIYSAIKNVLNTFIKQTEARIIQGIMITLKNVNYKRKLGVLAGVMIKVLSSSPTESLEAGSLTLTRYVEHSSSY